MTTTDFTETTASALTYRDASADAEFGVDISTATEGAEPSLAWHPLTAESWSIDDADALLATLGWQRIGPWVASDDLGGGAAGWEAPLAPAPTQDTP